MDLGLINMVKILSSERFSIDGMTLLLISNIAKDIEDPKLKEQLNDVVKVALENKIR